MNIARDEFDVQANLVEQYMQLREYDIDIGENDDDF